MATQVGAGYHRPSTRPSSKDDYLTFIDKYDTWLFDCDGVIWNGDRIVEGAIETLAMLRSRSENVPRFMSKLT